MLESRDFAFELSRHALERLKSASANANLNATQADGLQVHILTTLGCAVGMAAGLAKVGAFAGKLVDAGHKIWPKDSGKPRLWQEWYTIPMFQLLLSEPLVFAAWLLAFLFALSIHEFSHALVGTWLGDSTAQRLGRLTVNPAAHVDPLGLLMVALIGFGWGKPVPFNPYNLKWQRWGPVAIAFAGPISNLIMAVIFTVLFALIAPRLGLSNLLVIFLMVSAQINIALMAFNLLPIPPLDGSKLLLAALGSPKYAGWRDMIEQRGPFLLLIFILVDSFGNLGIFSSLISWASGLVFSIASLFA